MIRFLLLVVVVGAIAAYVFRMILVLDVNKRVYNHRPGQCRQVEGIAYGSEDIALLENEGIAFITSGIFYMSPRGRDVKGQIFLYDFNQKGTWKVESVKINGEYDQEQFHPHGISHIVTANGSVRLFVISHSKEFKHSVMVLDWKEKSRELDLVKVVKDEKFIRPNDIVAISEDAFILSNDGTAQTVLTNVFELMLQIPSGSVVYYDGKKSSWLLPKATSPNGIIFDRARKHLLVSHINDETLSIYRMEEAAHPIMKEALGHLGECDNLSKYAPSQVLRIKFSSDFKEWEITEPFADDGRLISASSIAVPFKNQLLVGSVCRQLVHCDITQDTI